MEKRRASFFLVGLVLLLVSGGGWLAHRPDRAPAAPRGATRAGAPLPDAPPSESGPGLPSGAAAKAVAGTAPMDPARARCLAAWQRIERERTAQLATEPDADSQLAAALLDDEYTPGPAANEAARLRRQHRLQWAVELAPEDPLVSAHAHRRCTGDDGCDAARTLDHLVRVDPDNAWTWIAVLKRAQAQGDSAGIERALERVADSRTIRSHYGRTALRIAEAFGEPRLPAGCASRMFQGMGVDRPVTPSDWIDFAIGTRALVALPSPHPLAAECRADIPGTQRRALCIRALEHFAAGETLVEVALASSLLAQLTAGTKEGAAWRERYRNVQWLLAQTHSRKLLEQASPLEWWQRGEVRFLEDRLQAADAWPAPAGWLPEGKEARSLVLTGRRPPAR